MYFDIFYLGYEQVMMNRDYILKLLTERIFFYRYLHKYVNDTH